MTAFSNSRHKNANRDSNPRGKSEPESIGCNRSNREMAEDGENEKNKGNEEDWF